MKRNDIVRVTRCGDQWDGMLAQVIKYSTWRATIEFLTGPYKGERADGWNTSYLEVVSPLEQLAEEAE